MHDFSEQARTYLRIKKPFVWNATNITKQLRTQLIDLFREYGAQVKIVYLEVPYHELMRRNKTREYPLPFAVLEKMIKKMEEPTLDECTDIEYVIKE